MCKYFKYLSNILPVVPALMESFKNVHNKLIDIASFIYRTCERQQDSEPRHFLPEQGISDQVEDAVILPYAFYPKRMTRFLSYITGLYLNCSDDGHDESRDVCR